MKAYNEALDEFQKYDAQLVAVSPELPDSTLSTKEKDSLRFEVLSDVGNTIGREYGVVYTLPSAVAERLGEVVAKYNGDNSATLPLGVTYVIDTHGVIRYAFLDPDYKKRAEPAELVSALKKL